MGEVLKEMDLPALILSEIMFRQIQILEEFLEEIRMLPNYLKNI